MQSPHRKLSDPLPTDQPAAEGEPETSPSPDRPGVLVVDDEHLVRIIVQLGLERDGFDVLLASSGREAIQLYRAHRERIAVVLLDVRMPGLDGPATFDALRELNPEILVCFMSGYTGADALEALRQRGAAAVIAKPFHLDDLACILRLLAESVPADLVASSGGCRGELQESCNNGGKHALAP
jgi:CheY-like chemotaxis protein